MAYIDPIRLLKAAGVTLSLDWDNSMSVTAGELVPYELRQLVEEFRGDLTRTLVFRAQNATWVFSGGPWDGKKHGIYLGGRMGMSLRIGPKRWAAYRTMSQSGVDGRLIYCGEATSEKKANLMYAAAFEAAQSTKP